MAQSGDNRKTLTRGLFEQFVKRFFYMRYYFKAFMTTSKEQEQQQLLGPATQLMQEILKENKKHFKDFTGRNYMSKACSTSWHIFEESCEKGAFVNQTDKKNLTSKAITALDALAKELGLPDDAPQKGYEGCTVNFISQGVLEIKYF